MSRIIKSLRFLLAGIVLCFAVESRVTAQGYDDGYGDQASYQQFYDELSPYGEWVNDPDYGYVWVPDAGNDFRPYYSDGYWVNSEYGNTWVSNYPWGWAPFHYGRWTYSSYYGWMWIPGNVWGPAWVSWRSGGGSYGWAPLGPGISISVGIGDYYAPDYWWVFTPQQYILNQNFHNYCYGPRYNPQYIHQTTIINNTYVNNHHTYISGPRRPDMEHAIGRPVQQVAINNSPRPSRTEFRGNTVSMYRPQINESRPRPTERPRSFTPVREPISSSPATSPRINDRGGVQQQRPVIRDRGTIQQAPVQQQTTQPNRGNRTPDAPRQERPRTDPVMQVPQQQPDQRPREWRNVDRAPQQAQPQRTERPAIDRNMDIQRQQDAQRQQEMQRQQQVQRQQQMDRQQEIRRQQEAARPAPPQRIERPAPEQRPQPVQRTEQPVQRTEQPVQRTEQPRQEAPRQAPVERTERPEMGRRR